MASHPKGGVGVVVDHRHAEACLRRAAVVSRLLFDHRFGRRHRWQRIDHDRGKNPAIGMRFDPGDQRQPRSRDRLFRIRLQGHREFHDISDEEPGDVTENRRKHRTAQSTAVDEPETADRGSVVNSR